MRDAVGDRLTTEGDLRCPPGGHMRQGSEMWQVKAACRGPQAAVFFPPSHAERKEEKASREIRAKAICQQCHVRGDCLEYAIRIREPHGIWGGLNEVERKTVLDRRAS
jgi:WhiB family redox-sensing transcriptional regulator